KYSHVVRFLNHRGVAMPSMICTSAMCAQGRVSVQEMRSTFDELSKRDDFNRGYFEPTVTEIERSYNDSYSIFSEWIPFNPECCAIKDIGSQADSITAAMLTSVHVQAPVPGPASQKPPLDIDNLMTLGALVLGVILLSNLSAIRR